MMVFLRLSLLWFFFLILPGLSQAQYSFGRNKVQYSGFTWQVLKTSHFDIYYDGKMQELAELGAGYAEEAYDRLKIRFGLTLSRRIPLIFYSTPSRFEETNVLNGLIPPGVGGFFEFLKGRVVIPSDGNMFRFRHVIRHELVHVFTHARFSEIQKTYKIKPENFFPLWFTEGIAEHWSGDPPDVQADMVIRDAVFTGQVVPVSQFYRINGSYLMYKLGENLLGYISRTYGDEAIAQLFDNVWRTTDFEENLHMTIGKTYADLDRDWIYDLKKQYLPQLKDHDFPSAVSQPVQSKGFNHHPVFWRDPESGILWCYFIGNHQGYTSLYRSRPDLQEDGTEPEAVLVLSAEDKPGWEVIRALEAGLDISAGGKLAVAARSGESDVIHVLDAVTLKELAAIRPGKIQETGSLNWDRAGTRLVFSGLDQDGKSDLFLLDTRTLAVRRLTADFYDDQTPVFLPGDSLIAFSSDRIPDGINGSSGLFALSLKTGRLCQLSRPVKASEMVSSVDSAGKWLYCTSSLGGTRNAVRLPVDQIVARFQNPASVLTAEKLTRVTTPVFYPSERNGLLFFSAFEDFSFRIRSVPLSGLPEPEKIQLLPAEYAPFALSAPAGFEKKQEPLKYEKEYTLDFAQGVVATEPLLGTIGGVSLAYGEMLGDDQFFLTVYNTAETPSELLQNLNFSVSRLVRGNRVNHAYGLYHFRGRRYDYSDPDVFFNERLIGGFFTLLYPLSRFDRFETSSSLAWSEKKSLGYPGLYGGDVYLKSGGTERNAFLISNSVSYVFDNTLWAYTGPLDGRRYSFSLGYTTDFRYHQVSYYTVMADYRQYFRLTDRSAWAFRVQTRMNEGAEARRFYMIGAWDIRGYGNFNLRGNKLWMMNQEIRFPVLDNLGIWFPRARINLPMVRGAAFFDMGNAWDGNYPGHLGSFGAGIRYNFMGALVLRYDVGRTWTGSPDRFSDTSFHRFFFGWDF